MSAGVRGEAARSGLLQRFIEEIIEGHFILSGKGRYNDNGTITEIGAGDVAYCAPGEGHGLACIGEEPVEMIALILYA